MEHIYVYAVLCAVFDCLVLSSFRRPTASNSSVRRSACYFALWPRRFGHPILLSLARFAVVSPSPACRQVDLARRHARRQDNPPQRGCVS